MADSDNKTITQLTSTDAVSTDDLSVYVNDPSGTPATKARAWGSVISDLQAPSSDVDEGLSQVEIITPYALANSGSSDFPASPVDGQRHFRTDLMLLCFYDLANTQWLTVQEYNNNVSRTGISADETRALATMGTYAPYFTRISAATYVDTTNDGTKYWTVKVQGQNLAKGSTTDIYSFTTASDTASTWTTHHGSASTPSPTNNKFVISAVSKTSTPGNIDYDVTIHWHYIIT